MSELKISIDPKNNSPEPGVRTNHRVRALSISPQDLDFSHGNPHVIRKFVGDEMDKFLKRFGLLRRPTPVDGEYSLYRAICEELTLCQSGYKMIAEMVEEEVEMGYKLQKIRNLDGDLVQDKMKDRLKAAALLFNLRIKLYTGPDDPVVIECPSTDETDNKTNDKKDVLLYHYKLSRGGDYYERLYAQKMQRSLAISQGILYDALYTKEFRMKKETIKVAIDHVRLDIDCADGDLSNIVTPAPFSPMAGGTAFSFNTAAVSTSNNKPTQSSRPYRPPIPYSAVKSLDPAIYRNVPFDLHSKKKKELKSLAERREDEADAASAYLPDMVSNAAAGTRPGTTDGYKNPMIDNTSTMFPVGCVCLMKDDSIIQQVKVLEWIDDSQRKVLIESGNNEKRELVVPVSKLRADYRQQVPTMSSYHHPSSMYSVPHSMAALSRPPPLYGLSPSSLIPPPFFRPYNPMPMPQYYPAPRPYPYCPLPTPMSTIPGCSPSIPPPPQQFAAPPASGAFPVPPTGLRGIDSPIMKYVCNGINTPNSPINHPNFPFPLAPVHPRPPVPDNGSFTRQMGNDDTVTKCGSNVMSSSGCGTTAPSPPYTVPSHLAASTAPAMLQGRGYMTSSFPFPNQIPMQMMGGCRPPPMMTPGMMYPNHQNYSNDSLTWWKQKGICNQQQPMPQQQQPYPCPAAPYMAVPPPPPAFRNDSSVCSGVVVGQPQPIPQSGYSKYENCDSGAVRLGGVDVQSDDEEVDQCLGSEMDVEVSPPSISPSSTPPRGDQLSQQQLLHREKALSCPVPIAMMSTKGDGVCLEDDSQLDLPQLHSESAADGNCSPGRESDQESSGVSVFMTGGEAGGAGETYLIPAPFFSSPDQLSSISVNVNPSKMEDGSDLPDDTRTLRYFFNLGVATYRSLGVQRDHTTGGNLLTPNVSFESDVSSSSSRVSMPQPGAIPVPVFQNYGVPYPYGNYTRPSTVPIYFDVTTPPPPLPRLNPTMMAPPTQSLPSPGLPMPQQMPPYNRLPSEYLVPLASPSPAGIMRNGTVYYPTPPQFGRFGYSLPPQH